VVPDARIQPARIRGFSVATDIRQIVASLVAFYDLTGKTVVAVGAGGGRLVEYARPARRVIAIDRDEAAIEQLAARVRECEMADRFTLLKADFLTVRPRGDVVLFEFCLHQMSEPERALGHAADLAPDVLVLDHAPTSRWSWYAAEEGKVEAGWKAVERGSIRRRHTVEAFQHFRNYAELEAKLASQGPTSRERIGTLRGQRAISIPMPYWLALL
jgi:predicted RNA methylase